MKSIPWSDISLGLGNGGGSFVAPRWNMIALVILSAHLSREKKKTNEGDVPFIIKVQETPRLATSDHLQDDTP